MRKAEGRGKKWLQQQILATWFPNSTTNSSPKHTVPQQTARKEETSRKLHHSGLFFFFLNLDSIFFSTHQRKCHLPAHHEVSRVEKEFPERKFSLFVYGSFTKRADHSRRQITKSPNHRVAFSCARAPPSPGMVISCSWSLPRARRWVPAPINVLGEEGGTLRARCPRSCVLHPHLMGTGLARDRCFFFPRGCFCCSAPCLEPSAACKIAASGWR